MAFDVNDDKSKGHIRISNEDVYELIRIAGVDGFAFYCILQSHADNRKGTAHPGKVGIRKKCGLSYARMEKGRSALLGAEVIAIKQRPGFSPLYTIQPKSRWSAKACETILRRGARSKQGRFEKRSTVLRLTVDRSTVG